VPVLNSSQVRLWKADDGVAKFAIFEVARFSTGDTIDFGAAELNGHFSSVKFAYIADVTGLKAGTCTVAGLVVTLAPTGMVDDGGYLVVYGATA
jgi:hypothetical protein